MSTRKEKVPKLRQYCVTGTKSGGVKSKKVIKPFRQNSSEFILDDSSCEESCYSTSSEPSPLLRKKINFSRIRESQGTSTRSTESSTSRITDVISMCEKPVQPTTVIEEVGKSSLNFVVDKGSSQKKNSNSVLIIYLPIIMDQNFVHLKQPLVINITNSELSDLGISSPCKSNTEKEFYILTFDKYNLNGQILAVAGKIFFTFVCYFSWSFEFILFFRFKRRT